MYIILSFSSQGETPGLPSIPSFSGLAPYSGSLWKVQYVLFPFIAGFYIKIKFGNLDSIK